MERLRKFLYVLSWIPPLLIKAILAVMGLFLIPLFLINRTQEHWRIYGRYFASLWWLWDNKEEGCPEWWIRSAVTGEKGKIAKLFPRWWWFAIRNPVNGFRWIFKDRAFPTVEGWQHGSMEAKDLIEHNVNSASRWVYSGPFAGYRRVWLNGNKKYSEFWIGWKIGSSVPGLGFTIQWRRKRDIGT